MSPPTSRLCLKAVSLTSYQVPSEQARSSSAIIAASCVALFVLLFLSFFLWQGKIYSQRRCVVCRRRCKKNKMFFQHTYRHPKTKAYKVRRWWLGGEVGHCQDCPKPESKEFSGDEV